MESYMDIQPVNCKIKISPFIQGIARLFDFVQVLDRPGSMTAADVDNEAINNDWEALGKDMWRAIEQIREELGCVKQEQNTIKA